MCGIFGVMIRDPQDFPARVTDYLLRDLFLFSESRGKEASGLAVLGHDTIEVIKSPIAASRMIRTSLYQDFIRRFLPGGPAKNSYPPFIAIGHSRLVTTGSQKTVENNQPVIADGIVGIHNGIVTNHEELWDAFPSLTRRYEVDTEVILALVRNHLQQSGSSVEALQHTFSLLQGATSVALLFEDLDQAILATNNGSLYECHSPDGRLYIFASEHWILHRLIQQSYFRKAIGPVDIHHITPGSGRLIDVRNLAMTPFALAESEVSLPAASKTLPPRRTVLHSENQIPALPHRSLNRNAGLTRQVDTTATARVERVRRLFPHDPSEMDGLRRCTRCILPETMPFIDFDDDGVCSYCRNYTPLEFAGVEALEEVVAPLRGDGNRPDCVVGLSGGRDSMYGLHYITTVLKMHPVAYTYDWGMVTDLARRNISRICGKLGIENILVSADITRKREFIRKNVAAWLKRPRLGMIPLFMAGDKQYFYYAQQVRRQNSVDIIFLCENMLEREDFKTGFAGVPPFYDKHHVYTLPLSGKIHLAAYYGKEYLLNPAYLNASLTDTLIAFGCYYLIDRNYKNLYSFIPWIEEEVVSTLIREYDFELSKDTISTWRIGDGTSAFYNYIYYTLAGFTENDTFRSNQIREGLITREEALRRVREENRPRFAEIDWYLNIINLELDIEQVLHIIHAAPKLYRAVKTQG